MERSDAVRRSLAALRFFRDSDQSGSPTATGYKGFYYHFLDPHTGARVWRSELSMIDTALLIAGVLTAACISTADTPDEIELRELADMLYRRIDWRWAQDGGDTIRQGWKPECGFLHYGWEGYSEAIVLYALALGSPTHRISSDCYKAWTATYQWENLYGHDFLYAGALFVHQFSHAWIDFRGIRDRFMREKRSDYFENSRRAVLIQREYARRNPHEFAGYDENCWGLSACDGPSDERPDVSNEQRRLFGYAARSVPYGPDDGTLVRAGRRSPRCRSRRSWRSSDAQHAGALSRNADGWARSPAVSTRPSPTPTAMPGCPPVTIGLDQGIVLMMIENHRNEADLATDARLPVSCAPVCAAPGFRGGWLDAHPAPRTH